MMEFRGILSFSVFAVLLLLAIHAQAYTWRGPMDTSSGYCEGENYGRIPVGGYGYDDVKCEKISCVPGGIRGHGCSPMRIDRPGCRLVAGQGHYPNCCRHRVECDDEE